MAGKDATQQFWKYHNESILDKYKTKLLVGVLKTKEGTGLEIVNNKHNHEQNSVAVQRSDVLISQQSSIIPDEVSQSNIDIFEPFGDLVPHADPYWYYGVRCNPQKEENICMCIQLTTA